MADPKYTVGQEVWLVNSRRRDRVTVSKVGRTLVYIKQYGRDVAFRMDSGYENTDIAARHIMTDADLEAADRRAAVDQRLRDAGLRCDYSTLRRYSVETWEKIADLLEGDRA